MVGGGQLGRMFAMAAASMGYRVVVFSESADTPAGQVAHRTVVGSLNDHEAVARFASECDVITLEFENIPAETMRRCSEHAPVYPAASVLAIAQDRLIEKTTLKHAGLPVTPFAQVTDAASLIEASTTLGWPLVVKTARDGYDGKGQYKIQDAGQANEVPWASFGAWIAEKWMPFEKEVSVVVAVSTSGESAAFPVFENDHAHHILDVSLAPARLSDRLADAARSVAIRAAETLGVVGLLCVEFFVVGEDVVINEVAPRPHNSAHLTLEATHTSQFEQHVRAVCGLPLGNAEMKCPHAAMANLLGDLWIDESGATREPSWPLAMQDSGIHVHLYGKQDAKAGRKMGHLTVTGGGVDEVRQRVIQARDRISAT